MSPSVVVVSIGSEFTTGRNHDSHGRLLGAPCFELDLSVSALMQRPDDRSIAARLRDLLGNVDLLALTRGIWFASFPGGSRRR